jgi:hypothetical protein
MLFEGMIIGGIAMLFLFALSILSFVFWIMMLVDSIKRKFKRSDERLIWVIVIVLTGIIGSLIYYFVVKRNAKN